MKARMSHFRMPAERFDAGELPNIENEAGYAFCLAYGHVLEGRPALLLLSPENAGVTVLGLRLLGTCSRCGVGVMCDGVSPLPDGTRV